MLPLAAPQSWAEQPSASNCKTQFAKLRFEDQSQCSSDLETDQWAGNLKQIPLQNGAVFSLGGETRQRYELANNPGFGADPEDDNGVWLQRYTLHADLELNDQVRIFGQLFSAFETGRKAGPSPVDENRLSLQNAFIDLSTPDHFDTALRARLGRQELQFGSGRLIDVREGPNVRRSFDGGRLTLTTGDWTIDALAALPVAPEFGVFDDRHSDDQSLIGVYAAGTTDWLPAGGIDIYALRSVDENARYEQGIGEEERYSLGARYHGAKGGFDWNWEAILQLGEFADQDILAWSLATDTGYTFDDAAWTPRLAVNANIASGDDDPNDDRLGSFNPLFPRGNYFSEAALLAPINFFNIHPFLSAQPTDRLALQVDWNFFWRLETEDATYAPPSNILRSPNGSDERFVGSAVSMSAEYELTPNLRLGAIYIHFFTGEFLDATGPSDDVDFLELTLTLKF